MIYCATTNPGKLAEFRRTLEVEALPRLREIEPPEETGSTFEENARAKAIYYSKFCDELLFVDDSGLEVDALGGAPGVYSARYAGADATDEANNQLVLEQMRGVQDRRARFVAVVALARRGGVIRTFRGEVEGVLLEEARGRNGFGYDPIFFYPPFGCTFGEADLEEKLKVSHRSIALRAMAGFVLLAV